jgi:hypothetical protein
MVRYLTSGNICGWLGLNRTDADIQWEITRFAIERIKARLLEKPDSKACWTDSSLIDMKALGCDASDICVLAVKLVIVECFFSCVIDIYSNSDEACLIVVENIMDFVKSLPRNDILDGVQDYLNGDQQRKLKVWAETSCAT